MNTTSQQLEMQMVDLGEYTINILACGDRPLFEEAVKAARVGALRASYLMIWLSCAESLKRRFREAQVRDNAAGEIVGRIEAMEQQQRAVDNFLLDKALKYGFLSDSEKTILSQIYEMRCIYAHPYEEAPSEEKVKDAAASVVELVLSRPVKLRYGFVKQLLESLLRDANYLDDYSPAVEAFTKNILPRIDENIYVWLLDEYWNELEELSDDSSMAVFTRRGIGFCQTMLVEVGVTALTQDQWHDRCRRFPKTLMAVCATSDLFKSIGERASDSLVGSILEESATRASSLKLLESLSDEGALSERQNQRFVDGVSELSRSTVRASGLRTKTCYAGLIDALTSYNWYIQNPAIAMIVSKGPEQASELSEEQQVNLGRNVLQAGEGSSSRAIEFLQNLASDAPSWPFGIIRGIALESFTNENNGIRLKICHLNSVLAAVDQIDSKQRNELIAETVDSVKAGELQSYVHRDDFNRTVNSLSVYSWSAPLAEILAAKVAPTEQDDE